MRQNYFSLPFAFAGDVTPIPTPLQTNGQVSFNQGWGFDYQRDQANDPLAKDIDRNTMNWLFGVITAQLQQYQQAGIPEFITAANNGGTPYPYGIDAVVLWSADGVTNLLPYVSTSANNTALPSDASHWLPVGQGIATQDMVNAGASTNTIVTPATLAAYLASHATSGMSFGTNYYQINTTTTLPNNNIGSWAFFNYAGTTAHLPPANLFQDGAVYTINGGGFGGTIDAPASSYFYNSSNQVVSSITVSKSGTVMITAESAYNAWRVISDIDVSAADVAATYETQANATSSYNTLQANINGVANNLAANYPNNSVTNNLQSEIDATNSNLSANYLTTSAANAAFVPSSIVLNSGANVADDSNNIVTSSWLRQAMSNIASVAGFAFNSGGASPHAAGYIKLPSWLGGFIIQWADFNTSSGGFSTWTYPITFPTGYLAAWGTEYLNSSVNNQTVINPATASASGVQVASCNTSQGFAYSVLRMIAIGY